MIKKRLTMREYQQIVALPIVPFTYEETHNIAGLVAALGAFLGELQPILKDVATLKDKEFELARTLGLIMRRLAILATSQRQFLKHEPFPEVHNAPKALMAATMGMTMLKDLLNENRGNSEHLLYMLCVICSYAGHDASNIAYLDANW